MLFFNRENIILTEFLPQFNIVNDNNNFINKDAEFNKLLGEYNLSMSNLQSF